MEDSSLWKWVSEFLPSFDWKTNMLFLQDTPADIREPKAVGPDATHGSF